MMMVIMMLPCMRILRHKMFIRTWFVIQSLLKVFFVTLKNCFVCFQIQIEKNFADSVAEPPGHTLQTSSAAKDISQNTLQYPDSDRMVCIYTNISVVNELFCINEYQQMTGILEEICEVNSEFRIFSDPNFMDHYDPLKVYILRYSVNAGLYLKNSFYCREHGTTNKTLPIRYFNDSISKFINNYVMLC